jgi:hypothetical protein
MGFYRIYCLDGVSRFITAEEIEAERATGKRWIKASKLHGGLQREVWQRQAGGHDQDIRHSHTLAALPSGLHPLPLRSSGPFQHQPSIALGSHSRQPWVESGH